jgi:Leu/Phe-tRNA-protein transferase
MPQGATIEEKDNDSGSQEEESSHSDTELFNRSEFELEAEYFLPNYLRPVVFPYYGEFCQTHIFHHKLIIHLMAEGYLPMANKSVLLPKLHVQRCVMWLPNQLHISKSTRKKSSKFTITLNTAFRDVVNGCHEQHSNCWLEPPLVEAFEAIYSSTTAMKAAIDGKTCCPVRFYSTEVWQASNLVAGELGYTVGSVYTSLTGFSKVDSAGSVQMAALGSILCAANFSMWDLGMDMTYKRQVGAQLLPRAEFLQHIHAVRGLDKSIPRIDYPVSCKDLIQKGQCSQPSDSSSNNKPQLSRC